MKRRKAGSAPKRTPKGPKATFDQAKEVRAIARERLGTVKPAKVLVPKTKRKKPKHKKAAEEME
jgi:hypothetical protein